MTASRAHRDLVVFDLRFGPDLDHKAVQAFLGALSGLLPQRRQQPFVALEVHARRRGILHRLVAPEPMRASIEAALADDAGGSVTTGENVLEPLTLTADEKSDLLQFLQSLTGAGVAPELVSDTAAP